MIDISMFDQISPYVRMMRLKKEASMSGKWRDIDHVFTYIAAGSADFFLDGVKYHLDTGDVIIIPPYVTHMIVSSGTEPLIQYITHFDFYETEERVKLVHKDVLDEADLRGVLPERERILENRAVIAKIPENERDHLNARFLEMMREFFEDRPGRKIVLRAGCLFLIVLALRYCVELGRPSDVTEQRSKSWIHVENAMEYILASDFVNGLDNKSIAAAIGVSTNYLTSIFRSCLGISLHKYIIKVRMDRAQQLLLSGRVNVTEAAYRTGFSSIHVFSKTFKSVFGITPSQFLNEIVSTENMDSQYQQKIGGNYVD